MWPIVDSPRAETYKSIQHQNVLRQARGRIAPGAAPASRQAHHTADRAAPATTSLPLQEIIISSPKQKQYGQSPEAVNFNLQKLVEEE